MTSRSSLFTLGASSGWERSCTGVAEQLFLLYQPQVDIAVAIAAAG